MRPLLIVAGVFLLEAILNSTAEKPSLLESFLHVTLVDGAKNFRSEPKDRRNIYREYDFIIVGAGSAGCIVANRLSEIKNWNILLIEAGGEENFLMDVPLFANFWQFTSANWKYKTQPSEKYCLGMVNNQCHWPRGKVMGGSSVLNYMIYTKGGQKDYDKWEELGNTGWSWKGVKPYFDKSQGGNGPEQPTTNNVYDTEGHMHVGELTFKTAVADAFVESGRYLGYPKLDYEAPTPNGFEYLHVTIKNGTRWSSSRAYLHPVSNRPNLHVKKRSMVTRIVIDPETKRAKGVDFTQNGNKYFVRATKEVILSAGSINSPQILMLSGVGPKKHLAKKKIKVIQDAKVGYNMQDHYMPGGLTYIIDKPYSYVNQRVLLKDPLVDYLNFHQGPLSSPGGCEALAYFNLENTTDPNPLPNIELLLISGGIPSDPSLYLNFNIKPSINKVMFEPLLNQDTVMVFPVLLTSKSKGRILLQDNNPYHHPLIYPNYFSDPEGYDVKAVIAGIRKTNEVMSAPPMKKLGTRLWKTPLPQCATLQFDSDAYWECFARHFTFTIYHPVGTCKMGPDTDPSAVVDPRLRVRGIQNIRVIDASVMPVIPIAHTNAPTYMIAEKGSDLIKEDWGVYSKR